MSVTTRTNLVTNPSFEVDLTGVTGAATLTISRSVFAPAAVSGVASMGISVGAGATTFTYVYQDVAMTAGNWLAFAANYRLSGGSKYYKFRITWRTATADISSVDSPIFTAVNNSTGGLRQSFAGLAPAGTVTARLFIYLYDDAAGTVAPTSGTAVNTDVWSACSASTQAIALANVATYFDGSFTNGAGVVYAWTGTANASTSTATAYVPTVTVVVKTDAPCPRAEVTIQDLGTGSTVYNIWRTADNVRKIVRGARNKSTVGSDFLVDYEPSLGRTLTYDVEIVSGLATTAPTNPGTATVTSTTWWIQDPLVPSSAIALQTIKGNNALPDLTAAAVKDLEYAADVTIIPILGSSEPVALMSGRRLAGNVDFSMFTRAAEATAALRNLIQQTPLLLVRPNGATNNGVPGLAYFASAKPVEQPVNVDIGGTITRWQLTGDLVAAPSLDVLVPIWTYGDVDNLWTTYQQGQTTLASKTYLDVLKSPSGV